MERMVAEGLVSEADLRLFKATDDVDEVVAFLRTHAIEAFHLRAWRTPTPSRLLGEQRAWPARGPSAPNMSHAAPPSASPIP